MTETPQPLPAKGGSYIRNEKGELLPAPIRSTPEPARAPRNPPLKEA